MINEIKIGPFTFSYVDKEFTVETKDQLVAFGEFYNKDAWQEWQEFVDAASKLCKCKTKKSCTTCGCKS